MGKVKQKKTGYAVLDLTTNKIEVFKTRLDLCSYLGVSESKFYYNWTRRDGLFITMGNYTIQEVTF